MQISGVSQTAVDALRAKLASDHQTLVTGTANGTISGHGVLANYDYDSVHQTLSVEVLHHPFFVSASTIETRLRETLASVQ